MLSWRPAGGGGRARVGSGRGVLGVVTRLRMPCPAGACRRDPWHDRAPGSARAHPVVPRVVLQLRQAELLEQRRQVHAEATAVPFRVPYQPPTGLASDLPQASTVPSGAGFCSSAPPSGTQSPCSPSHAARSSMARRWYLSWVLPTWHTRTGGSAASSRHIWYADPPLAVTSCQGSSRVPEPAIGGLHPATPWTRRRCADATTADPVGSRDGSAPCPATGGSHADDTPRARALDARPRDAGPRADRARPQQRHRHQDGDVPQDQGPGRDRGAGRVPLRVAGAGHGKTGRGDRPPPACRRPGRPGPLSRRRPRAQRGARAPEPDDRRLGHGPGLRRTGRLVPGDPPTGGRHDAR